MRAPNVLFIVVDDLRPELGRYGNELVHTPNLDKLAGQSLLFERAYCQQAICSPSRISVLTGLRPDATGITDNHTHHRTTLPDVITLPQYFKENGYHSVGIGKIFHGHDHSFDDERAWSEPWIDAPQMFTNNIRGYLSKENLEILKIRNLNKNVNENTGSTIYAANITEAEDVQDNAYSDGVLAELAMSSLERLKDSTFFLAIGFRKPHEPYVAPKKYWDLYDLNQIELPAVATHPQNTPEIAYNNWEGFRNYWDMPSEGTLDSTKTRKLIQGYYACTSYVDAQVGKLMDKLRDLGLEKNTIIILWGDNGIKLGEYGDWSKKTNFELDVRVPLMVHNPNMKAKGKQSKALVELVDIYPTLCDLAGLEIPQSLQGTSFVPLLDKPHLKWKESVLSQYPRKIWVDSIQQNIDVMGYSLRTDRYRFNRWSEIENLENIVAIELYDHQNDPMEILNLANEPEYFEILKDLNDKLNEFRQNP